MILPPQVRALIQLALEEDLGRGDLTALAVPKNARAKASIVAKEDCVVAGVFMLEAVAREAQVDLKLELLADEGARLVKGSTVAVMAGPARDLLSLERTWLNFLQRTCGIATVAARVSLLVKEQGAQFRVTDTRKTLPGWRFLDKYAVKTGGLHNHRFGLDGGILVKENHIRAAGGITKAVQTLVQEIPHGLKVQVEVTTETEALEAIHAGAEALLLDNFTIPQLKVLVPRLREKKRSLLLEASGGVLEEHLPDFAATGVDIVSMGALTHSVSAADLSMLFEL